MKIDILKGQTIVNIDGMEKHNDVIIFTLDNGKRFKMYHDQCCCEEVYIDDVIGDYKDLLDTPILNAKECIKYGDCKEYDDPTMWTFYKLSTIKGYVDLRWYGTSNGYYSVEVNFEEIFYFEGE